MTTIIDTIEKAQIRKVPAFDPGDRVRVHFQVIEGTRKRTQVFEGIVIKRQGSGARETFTVRKHSFGVGVERTFPVHSPKIELIDVAARGEVRRAKLYYLRGRIGKRARVRERAWGGHEPVAADTTGAQDEAELVEAPAEAEVAAPEAEATAAEAGGTGESTAATAEDGAPEAESAADAEPEVSAESEPEPEPEGTGEGEGEAAGEDAATAPDDAEPSAEDSKS